MEHLVFTLFLKGLKILGITVREDKFDVLRCKKDHNFMGFFFLILKKCFGYCLTSLD